MTKEFNAPVSISVYLGSGKSGERLRENLMKRVKARESLSEVIVDLLKKADPKLFKGVDDNGSK